MLTEREAYTLVELLYNAREQCQEQLRLVKNDLDAAIRLCDPEGGAHIIRAKRLLIEAYGHVDADLEIAIARLRQEETEARAREAHANEYTDPRNDAR
jgi:hypothetical protein